MRKLWMVLVLTAAFAGVARADYVGPLTVSIYQNYSNDNGTEVTSTNCCPVTGDGTPFLDYLASFTSSDIMFGTDNNWHWQPFDQIWFAAAITGTFDAPRSGVYDFTLESDDGSKLYIDNILAVADGGSHPPTTKSGSIYLTAGDHSLDVNFFNCCGVLKGGYYGKSGVDLFLPTVPTPEPATLLMLLTGGLGALGTALRWRRRY
jgi:hypothetical protein